VDGLAQESFRVRPTAIPLSLCIALCVAPDASSGVARSTMGTIVTASCQRTRFASRRAADEGAPPLPEPLWHFDVIVVFCRYVVYGGGPLQLVPGEPASFERALERLEQHNRK
jgi:hypothetical protein